MLVTITTDSVIEFDDYIQDELQVEVELIEYNNVAPYSGIPTCPDDLYGYEELDFKIIEIYYFDDNNDKVALEREFTVKEDEDLYEAVLEAAREEAQNEADADADCAYEDWKADKYDY